MDGSPSAPVPDSALPTPDVVASTPDLGTPDLAKDLPMVTGGTGGAGGSDAATGGAGGGGTGGTASPDASVDHPATGAPDAGVDVPHDAASNSNADASDGGGEAGVFGCLAPVAAWSYAVGGLLPTSRGTRMAASSPGKLSMAFPRLDRSMAAFPLTDEQRQCGHPGCQDRPDLGQSVLGLHSWRCQGPVRHRCRSHKRGIGPAGHL